MLIKLPGGKLAQEINPGHLREATTRPSVTWSSFGRSLSGQPPTLGTLPGVGADTNLPSSVILYKPAPSNRCLSAHVRGMSVSAAAHAGLRPRRFLPSRSAKIRHPVFKSPSVDWVHPFEPPATTAVISSVSHPCPTRAQVPRVHTNRSVVVTWSEIKSAFNILIECIHSDSTQTSPHRYLAL